MNTLDIIIIILLAFFAVTSFFRGFIKEAFALGGIVLGVVVANFYYTQLGNHLINYIENVQIANILSYLILFIFTAVIVSILGNILKKFINLIFLKWVDRFIGLVFGFTKGLVIVFVLVLALTAILPVGSDFNKNSKLRPVIVSIGSFIPTDYFRNILNQKMSSKNYLGSMSSSKKNDVTMPAQEQNQ